MREQQILFTAVLVLNALIALVYFVCSLLRRKQSRSAIAVSTLVMLFCPVAGPCFFGLSYLIYRFFFSEPVDLEDVVFSKERVKAFVHADEERERNMVPLEEAVEITDRDGLRGLMMNVVRGDISRSLASIALALNSEDTETAHYAASVLQDALNDFRMNVQKQYRFILEHSEDSAWASHGEALIDYMNQVLEQKVFTALEQKSYVELMDEVCELLYERARGSLTSSMYEAVSMRLLEAENYESCAKWCSRAKEQYPNTLASYTCLLKLYFNSGQKEKFFAVIEELRQSAVVIDRETLELLRVFC